MNNKLEKACEAEQALASAIVVHSEEVIEQALNDMAAKINEDYKNRCPLILCVMNGGLIATARLVSKLTMPLEIDYIHATRYNNGTTGAALSWLAEPKISLEGRDIIIVDDILDEGVTLQALIKFCNEKGANSTVTAILARKVHDRCVDNQLGDYVGVDVPDKYVFGCGMDYKGFFRNLPAIFAIKE
ncbi:hypoxanthine-guanine phosphoribosyltransferase [Halioxenophilus sp. WMMB6]|uniref:hypoxanthine-guanine phosphoribosyltransferase n=1 Tax=Halioxenophilus sp. WMMB6 TaxID=3073815 RepID=UPI00295E4193|nr:hypoxanthine-guanine phosphoribosyltransferase [Halioxenophilus sp. WMMB6]